MQFIFDHMSAFFAMTGVMLIFGLIQMRGTQTASEAVINHMVYSEIVNFGEYLQTDLSNMRTEEQTQAAIADDRLIGGSTYACSLTKTGDVTTSFTFPTLADPNSTYSSSDPNQGDIELVTYQLMDSGQTINLNRGDSVATVPLYTIERMVDGKSTGGSQNYVTHFLIEVLDKSGSGFSSASSNCSAELTKVRFELKFATQGIEYITQDQKNTSQANISRYGSTVHLANMD